MTVVGIPRMGRHKAHTYPDITPHLEPVWTRDRRISVAVQELLALCFGASPDLPIELRLNNGKGIG